MSGFTLLKRSPAPLKRSPRRSGAARAAQVQPAPKVVADKF